MSEHLRKLEHMYHSAPANRARDPEIRVDRGAARVEMQVTADDYHAADAVHGHVVFKLLDDAAFFAANSLVETFVLTVHFDVHLLAPLEAGEVAAAGEVLHEGASSMLAQAVARGPAGEQVARGIGSFVKGSQPLDEVEGYASG